MPNPCAPQSSCVLGLPLLLLVQTPQSRRRQRWVCPPSNHGLETWRQAEPKHVNTSHSGQPWGRIRQEQEPARKASATGAGRGRWGEAQGGEGAGLVLSLHLRPPSASAPEPSKHEPSSAIPSPLLSSTHQRNSQHQALQQESPPSCPHSCPHPS